MDNRRLFLMLFAVIATAAACNINIPQPTPTAEPLLTETPTSQATPSPTTSPTTTPDTTTEEPIIISTPEVVETLAPTTLPTATETPGPYVYTIRENDTLGYIMQQQPWGYPPFDQAVINAIVELNDNISNPDSLPPVGSEILIPRRTATPIPEGIELTQASDAQLGVERFGEIVLQEGEVPSCHVVEANEAMVGIMERYNTTLEILSQLNPTLNWSGCRFNQYSGGEACNPTIREGDCVVVPKRAPTATPTATPSGDETATPTPTYVPSRLIFPSDGALASAAVFELEWVSSGILAQDEVYLVEIRDVTAGGDIWRGETRDTSLMLPESLIPADGQTHTMEWRVVVARRDDTGTYRYVGGAGDWRVFRWQSR